MYQRRLRRQVTNNKWVFYGLNKDTRGFHPTLLWVGRKVNIYRGVKTVVHRGGHCSPFHFGTRRNEVGVTHHRKVRLQTKFVGWGRVK